MAPVVAPPVSQEPAASPAAPVVTIDPDKKAEEKPAKPDNIFGSIEEEMASLLGRPSGKPS
jgi:hypothetical protein